VPPGWLLLDESGDVRQSRYAHIWEGLESLLQLDPAAWRCGSYYQKTANRNREVAGIRVVHYLQDASVVAVLLPVPPSHELNAA
jgi:hypothetical protein